MSYSLLYLTQGLAEVLHILRTAIGIPEQGFAVMEVALPLASVELRGTISKGGAGA